MSGNDDAIDEVVWLDKDETRYESDNEDDMIKGVFFEDEAGRYVALD